MPWITGLTSYGIEENDTRLFPLPRRRRAKCDYPTADNAGARASANLFSLVMTAPANRVDPFEYLSYLFEHLPIASTVDAIEALLRWNVKPLIEVPGRAK